MPLLLLIGWIDDHIKLFRYLCDAWLAVDYFACNASVWNLMMIAIDRHGGATRPFRHLANRTSKKAQFTFHFVLNESL